ncbi:alanine--tRNA ligase [Plebeiibacterium sediminum]|uniref:Alanine--tRNA ligase n=1 Tax=Plebeiibacterium sediminum TaxID=2992112 RepID=A0AAE3M768_9BACT|nr:alanine--tRNA ligase [Plebeiobacterium sediminum]MCW3787825.1 alanine--tRNA ligase [Plebeiobacterium sediminum]
MNASEVRKSFCEFFESKQHQIVSSAPMVVKNDPTLMFTNAGMNQFKDIFLGNSKPSSPRVANSQKCLRVSGKHNDLEEVGHDTYHHTMFEMLGNWSFGDYFKKEAISWAWEYLTDVLKLDKSRLYATVFEGDEEMELEKDMEAFNFWKEFLPEDRIINGNRKDNFWEMGDMGPCGPCSEIHIDLRSEDEIAKVGGAELVNQDHPEVIEIWNLVFIQYNRKANGDLEFLPQKHVDTGMGFERLCMALQGKKSNYDTDVFTPIIGEIAKVTESKYGESKEKDIAMRVIADHIRTISFSITDGQLPSNNKAGYVIRRILRRAVRYGYTFLDQRSSFMYKLLPALIQSMGDHYPELEAQKELITKVIKEEEESFLRTLATGITMLDKIVKTTKEGNYKVVEGKVAFELYDTYGFPLDLTELILKENDLVVNRKEFEKEMEAQKERARSATAVETEDWVTLLQDDVEEFIGYDYMESEITITKYRKITAKNKTLYQLVFNITPFYAESGGQVGDTGYIDNGMEKIEIIDTKKENNLIVHIAKKLPTNIKCEFKAYVNQSRRQNTANNHTGTHLLHQALREVLGTHVEQKGSLVHPDYLRFDFAHFQKMTREEIEAVEKNVNKRIRNNFALEEMREVPVAKAQDMGAMMLFGEKYGDLVRAIKFGDSIELCGGTHVKHTGEIGFFKIISESSISAGVRRIEAVTGEKAEEMIMAQHNLILGIQDMFKASGDLQKNIESLMIDNSKLGKELDSMKQNFINIEKRDLIDSAFEVGGVQVIAANVNPMLGDKLKDLAFQIKKEMNEFVAVLGANVNGKPQLSVIASEELAKSGKINAVEVIRDCAKEIQGGGGGQPFFATAGGKNAQGLDNAIEKAKAFIEEKLA